MEKQAKDKEKEIETADEPEERLNIAANGGLLTNDNFPHRERRGEEEFERPGGAVETDLFCGDVIGHPADDAAEQQKSDPIIQGNEPSSGPLPQTEKPDGD